MAKTLGVPFVSGKDSLSSTYRYPDGKVLKIPPVLLISVFGKIADIKKTQSSEFKKIGSTIVLVGNLDFKNLGGSAYFDVVNQLIFHSLKRGRTSFCFRKLQAVFWQRWKMKKLQISFLPKCLTSFSVKQLPIQLSALIRVLKKSVKLR